MRLFYDTYSSRLRGEILLLLVDFLAIGAAVSYATGAFHRRDLPSETLLLLLWAVLPRGLAKILGWLEKRSGFARIFKSAMFLVTLTAILLVTGWDLVYVSAPPFMPLRLGTFSVLLLAWGSGFFLFVPRFYRLHDIFLFATILLAFKDGKPLPLFWLPVFFLGFYLSCTLRHLLYDFSLQPFCPALAGGGRVRDPLNLQNARATAMLAAGASSLILLGAYFVLHGNLDFPLPRAELARAAMPLEVARGEARGAASEGERSAPAPAAWLAEKEGTTPPMGERIIRLRYQVKLRSLALARYDRREVLRVRGEGAQWQPSPRTLWRAVSFSTYDAVREEWAEEAQFAEENAPPEGRFVVDPAALSPRGPTTQLRHSVVTPVCRTFVTPYFALTIEAQGVSGFRRNTAGDIFPVPELSAGSEYLATISSTRDGAVPSSSAMAEPIDPRYLHVPSEKELGIDLTALGRKIFKQSAAGPAGKAEALRLYFRQNFRYSDHAHWEGGRDPLARFLQEEKVGDCTYLATAAALLLRAAGTPARLVVGFLGAEWDEEASEAVVRNGQAHAWVEFHRTPEGWQPLDPTSWVLLDPGYVPSGRLPLPLSRGEGAGDPATEKIPNPNGASVPPPFLQGKGAESGMGITGGDSLPSRPRPSSELGRKELASGESGAVDWLQVSELFNEEEALAAAEPGHGGARPDFTAALRTATFSYRDAGPEAPQTGRSTEEPAGAGAAISSETMRILLRGLLGFLGITVASFLILTFLRPRGPEEEAGDDEKAGGDEEPGASVCGVPAAALDRFDSDDPRERVFREYLRLQQALELTRNHRRPHQTPMEHGRKVSRGDARLGAAFQSLHRVLYRSVYGNLPATEKDAAEFARQCRKIRRVLG